MLTWVPQMLCIIWAKLGPQLFFAYFIPSSKKCIQASLQLQITFFNTSNIISLAIDAGNVKLKFKTTSILIQQWQCFQITVLHEEIISTIFWTYV